MKKIKEIYLESYFAYLIETINKRYVTEIKNIFFESLFWKMCVWFTENVMNSKIFRLFFDMEYISEIWYKSYFYKSMTYRIRKLSFKLERSNFKFNSVFIGIFLAFILIIRNNYWSNLVWLPLFIAIVLLFLSHNLINRIGTVFTLVNFIIIMFISLLLIAFPYKAVTTLIYLLLSIDFFFLISFSVRSKEDLEKIDLTIFLVSGVLCAIGFWQSSIGAAAASAVFGDGVSFGGILIMLFPFAFVYPMEFKKGIRRYLYLGFIFIMFWNVISATQSKAAFIGFIIELAVLLATDVKLAPFILVLMPFGLSSVIENFRRTWVRSTSYGNIITNIAGIFRQLWNYGFGVNSSKFMSIYNSVNNTSQDLNPDIMIPYVKISPVYKNIIIEFGAVIMFGFLYYILRLAHSALTMLFVGERKYKRFFAAGLAMLIGLSVSSFFESTLFVPRTLLIYWGMIGFLRAIRIMSLSVY